MTCLRNEWDWMGNAGGKKRKSDARRAGEVMKNKGGRWKPWV
jgi:hypothetical protein